MGRQQPCLHYEFESVFIIELTLSEQRYHFTPKYFPFITCKNHVFDDAISFNEGNLMPIYGYMIDNSAALSTST